MQTVYQGTYCLPSLVPPSQYSNNIQQQQYTYLDHISFLKEKFFHWRPLQWLQRPTPLRKIQMTFIYKFFTVTHFNLTLNGGTDFCATYIPSSFHPPRTLLSGLFLNQSPHFFPNFCLLVICQPPACERKLEYVLQDLELILTLCSDSELRD